MFHTNYQIQTTNIEKEIVGSLLGDPKKFPLLCQIPSAYFKNPILRHIWIHFERLYSQNTAYTPSELFELLKNYFTLSSPEKASEQTAETVIDLQNCSISLTERECRYYVNEMKKIHYSSLAANLAFEQANFIKEEPEKASERIFELSKDLLQISVNLDAKEEDTHIGSALDEAMEELGKRMKGDMTGIVPTGFKNLDEILGGGLDSGDLVILAGSTGSGKTAMGVNMLYNISSQKIPCVYFNIEMSRKQLSQRLLISHGRVQNNKIRSGTVSSSEYERLHDSMIHLRQLPIHHYSRSGLTVHDIILKCKHLKRTQNIGFIIIDYVQIVGSGLKNKQSHEEMSYITKELKCLARDLNVPILCLAQLNDEVGKRDNYTPQMSDIARSKSMAHDCDNVWLLHRPEYYLKDKEPPQTKPVEHAQWMEAMQSCKGLGELIMAKNRHGGLGKIALKFEHQFMTYSNREV